MSDRPETRPRGAASETGAASGTNAVPPAARVARASPSRRRHGPRRWAAAATSVSGAVLVGLASAWLAVRHADSLGVQAGPWRTSTLTGSADADPWTRARVAVGGLLALSRDETMYYVATTDSNGQALRSRCSYRVQGSPPKARWWSVTAYADDFFLFPNPLRRYSLNGSTATLDAQGRFVLVSGPQAPVAAQVAGADASPASPPGSPQPFWLPTPGDRGLLFTLRLYNPDPSLRAAPGTLIPPAIEPSGDCR